MTCEAGGKVKSLQVAPITEDISKFTELRIAFIKLHRTFLRKHKNSKQKRQDSVKLGSHLITTQIC